MLGEAAWLGERQASSQGFLPPLPKNHDTKARASGSLPPQEARLHPTTAADDASVASRARNQASDRYEQKINQRQEIENKLTGERH